MLNALARNWWVFLLNGICAIAFGVMSFAWPGITLLALVIMFGVYAVGDGLTAILASFIGEDESGRSWWQLLFIGIVGLLAGVGAVIWPGITAMALLVMIGFWAISRGILEILAAITLRKIIDNEWLLGLAGAASVLFGIVLIARPGAGVLAMIWLISAFAVVHGVLLVSLGLKVRRLGKILDAPRLTVIHSIHLNPH